MAATAARAEEQASAVHPSVQDPPDHREISVNVLGMRVDPVDFETALARVSKLLLDGKKGYVCAASVHGVLEARRNPHVAQAFAEAALVVPDGRPIVWAGRLQRHRDIRQVTGPDLMYAILGHPEFAGFSHFFYGGKPGVADELAERWTRQFPGTRIAGTFTPPFRELTPLEEIDLVDMLNRCRPDIIWVGISSPRQEILMRQLTPLLHHGLLFGVGAAFDFHTGRIRQCAPWVKRLGLQWLHRLMQDPGRLWRRNLHNMAFPWHIVLHLSGLKKYELRPASEIEAPAGASQRASAVSSSSAGSA